MKDSKTGKPLFNVEAWKKADNLLKEILLGYYSDPPGVPMYTKELKPDGSIAKNKYGMDKIECCQGTNCVEAFHKNLEVSFGGWPVGVAMASVLLSERRHRHNHRTSERRRDDFPRTGHCNTWKIDLLQSLVLMNHGIIIYPNWVNASNFKDTPESLTSTLLFPYTRRSLTSHSEIDASNSFKTCRARSMWSSRKPFNVSVRVNRVVSQLQSRGGRSSN